MHVKNVFNLFHTLTFLYKKCQDSNFFSSKSFCLWHCQKHFSFIILIKVVTDSCVEKSYDFSQHFSFINLKNGDWNRLTPLTLRREAFITYKVMFLYSRNLLKILRIFNYFFLRNASFFTVFVLVVQRWPFNFITGNL